MDTFRRPPSFQNNILFTVSADGEIRSLKSPQPSSLKKQIPQQNLRQVRYSINTAIEIARSEYIQIGLQRRYWDPPLLPQHHEPASDHLAVDSDNISRAVALTDIKISGDPIRLCTPDFRVEPRGLKVGACLFLNLPYGANDACGLQVKMKDGSASDQPKFILEVCAAVLDARAGKKMWRLCTQHDVTDMINEIALKRTASKPTSSMLGETSPNSDTRPHPETFDWTAFTEDELESQQHIRSNAASTTPRHSRTTRLSGSTLVPSAGSSARSTLIATTPTQYHHPQQGPLPAAPPQPYPAATALNKPLPPAPPPTPSLFATIPADVHSFLNLAQAIKHAHASRFFILVPRQHHCYRNRRRFEQRDDDDKPVLSFLGSYAISFVSAELHENGGELNKVVGAVERAGTEEGCNDGSGRRANSRALATGLRDRKSSKLVEGIELEGTRERMPKVVVDKLGRA
ncbi:uncharacterized protein LTHEOB_7626 [Lasiodiplodia theobromae]|uniref:uncharacterized protein n=1 Tax=Lasiodiplodia theobromae TaxID=45133 RepID=UPI0015C3F606|nr:uncharacterized protein LTHEOB_7626 [Lasiodiplodia theobromae]KAF4542434.1 hypothetical protein LTHEOB_7626 [Lasiodiplodia theobromae]